MRIRDGRVTGARLTGETPARDWLRALVERQAAADTLRTWVLAPVSAPPAGATARGRIVCNCFDMAETELAERFAAGLTLAEVQQRHGCGTSCGSCLPELRRLAAQHGDPSQSRPAGAGVAA